MLEKTKFLAEVREGSWVTGDYFTFTYETDEGVTTKGAILSKSTWREMGSPSTVTVTIEPGDQLNPEPIKSPEEEFDEVKARVTD